MPKKHVGFFVIINIIINKGDALSLKRRKIKHETIDTSILASTVFRDDEAIESAVTEEEKNNIVHILEENIHMNFSEEQKEVIKHEGSPLNVMACAGAGKSTVVVNKMFYIEKLHKVNPMHMLAITYNTEASIELETRYDKLKKSLKIRHNNKPTFKTFHALFYMLLKTLPKYKNAKVVTESEFTYELLNLVISDGSKEKKEILSDIMKYRGTVINKSISSDGLQNVTFEDVGFRPSVYKKVLEKYEELKARSNAMDFDDMMVIIQKELQGRNGDKLRTNFQNKFHYVFIDEFQDISKLQLDIMDDLIGDYNKFVSIGDDDQSIYSFRGSEPKYIRDFILRYPNAKRLFLGDNYRCKSEILKPVIPCIRRNDNRVEKDIRAFNEGGSISIVPIHHSMSEIGDKIKEDIANRDANGYSLEDFAILVRLNSQRMLLSDTLAEAGIQLDIGSMNYSLRNNKIYKNTIKIIKAVQEEDNTTFAEIGSLIFNTINRNVPASYAKDKYSNWYRDFVVDRIHFVPNKVLDTVKKLHDTNNAKNAIGYVWLLVSSYYEKLADKGYYNHQQTLDIFKHLFKISEGLTITKFFRAEKIKEQYLQFYCNSSDGVQIKTLHSVKGLEFKNVYLIGLDSDKFPNETHINNISKKYGNDAVIDYLEEERRLMYVGQTRAIDNLTLSYSVENPSIFLYELEGLELEGITDDEFAERKYFNKLGELAKPLIHLQ